MESLKISTGRINLQVVDDYGNERGIFSFNPTDVKSAEKVFKVQADFDTKQVEFERRIDECTTDAEKLSLLNEVVDYFKSSIDECFGEGSSKILFGDDNSLSMFEDFFTGITPYYEKASKERMAKYGVKSKKRKN